MVVWATCPARIFLSNLSGHLYEAALSVGWGNEVSQLSRSSKREQRAPSLFFPCLRRTLPTPVSLKPTALLFLPHELQFQMQGEGGAEKEMDFWALHLPFGFPHLQQSWWDPPLGRRCQCSAQPHRCVLTLEKPRWTGVRRYLDEEWCFSFGDWEVRAEQHQRWLPRSVFQTTCLVSHYHSEYYCLLLCLAHSHCKSTFLYRRCSNKCLIWWVKGSEAFFFFSWESSGAGWTWCPLILLDTAPGALNSPVQTGIQMRPETLCNVRLGPSLGTAAAEDFSFQSTFLGLAEAFGQLRVFVGSLIFPWTLYHFWFTPTQHEIMLLAPHCLIQTDSSLSF